MCTRTCSKCGETKDVSEFRYKRNTCNSCVAIYRKEHYNKCRESHLAQKKEYYIKNKEQITEYRKNHYQENRDEILKKDKIYKQKNKERYLSKAKIYNKEHSEKKKAYAKEYYQKNKEKRLEWQKEYYQTNIDKIKPVRKAYTTLNRKAITAREVERTKNDPIFRARKLARGAVRRILKSKGLFKNSSTEQIVGCTYEELVKHLEDNRFGFSIIEKGLDIDHIIPISTATTEEEVLTLCHYTNLQLLPSDYNQKIKQDNPWDLIHFYKYYYNSI